MANLFTLQFQIWSTLIAAAIFVAAAYLTGARRRAAVEAFSATILCSGLNMLWDLMAVKAGWWWYTGHPGALVPVLVYFAQDLVWCGALGLVGRRIYRRFNLLGVLGFIVFFSAIGSARDSFLSVRTGAIAFGSDPTSRIADFTCWLTLLLATQACILMADRLSNRISPTT